MPDIDNLTIRAPTLVDGLKVHHLIAQCPPLDPNSSYCNFLQCSHFADTCALAEAQGETLGFMSAYITPNRADTLFAWQVAVSKNARGAGLALRLLEHILGRSACQDVHYLETTITETNRASWALFEKFAQKRSTDIVTSTWLDKEKHFAGQHDSETLLRIGPF